MLKDLTQQRRRRRSATSPTTARTSGASSRRPRTSRPPPPSAARTSPPACSGSRPSCASCARRWPSSAPPPTPPRRTLRDLNASAGQLTRFLDNLGPFAESSRGNVRTLAKTADARAARDRGRQADRRRARPRRPRRRPSSPTTSTIVLSDLDDRKPRRREGQALAGRPGLHGLRGGPPIHLRPDDGHQHLRRERPHPEGQPLRLGVQRLPERRLAAGARRSRSPGFISRCLAAPRPEPARRHHRRPDRHRRRRSRRAEPVRQVKKKGKSKKAKDKPVKSKNAPGQPDLKKALEKLLHGGGGGNKPTVPSPALPNVAGPERPAPDRPDRRRSSRTSRRLRPAAGGSQGPPRLPAEPMRGRAASSVFANPVLVGAVTVLVVIVAVFLSYNANNGLPFVPDDVAEGALRQRRRTSSRATRSAPAASASAWSRT